MNSFRKILFLITPVIFLVFNFALAASTDVNTKLQILYEATPVTDDGGGGIVDPVTVPSFNIRVTSEANVITLGSNRDVKYIISLGETNSLERGIIMQGTVFLKEQQIVVPGLLPGQ